MEVAAEEAAVKIPVSVFVPLDTKASVIGDKSVQLIAATPFILPNPLTIVVVVLVAVKVEVAVVLVVRVEAPEMETVFVDILAF